VRLPLLLVLQRSLLLRLLLVLALLRPAPVQLLAGGLLRRWRGRGVALRLLAPRRLCCLQGRGNAARRALSAGGNTAWRAQSLVPRDVQSAQRGKACCQQLRWHANPAAHPPAHCPAGSASA
jgi:hypothetical protein